MKTSPCSACGHRFLLSGKREPNYRDYEQSHGRHSKELRHKTCSQRYDEDGTIFFSEKDTVGKKYKEFAKEFRGWKDPKIKEESPLREYILATYNNELAAKYGVKPCPDVPANYFQVLSFDSNKNVFTRNLVEY